ncbi:MAG: hypothetical protein CVV64_07910 [Candidatus Wallbacteria bacterium HGW-Wallbacteria-1]|uniref:Uncharacterized protein n=1 Tax=Candidatus Wallbacteria bacterium HGW-Wallbacteria-1 TaxID=2013854 RepID=A0A2N1PR38_9BACT|nr:MAG: hypothetical protein CVV64_07910 [Candidatus Wallbacteria bacterium HGW-Wallbacteria-1]
MTHSQFGSVSGKMLLSLVFAGLLILMVCLRHDTEMEIRQAEMDSDVTGVISFVEERVVPDKSRMLLSSSSTKSVCELPDGKIAISSTAGIVLIPLTALERHLAAEKNEFDAVASGVEFIGAQQGLSSLNITASIHHQGYLWVATSDSGLFRIGNGQVTRQYFSQPSFNCISSLSASSGKMAIGTRGGLIVHSNTVFRLKYSKGPVVRVLADPFSDDIFLADSGNRILLVRGDKIQEIISASGKVLAMKSSVRGLLWGTATGLWHRDRTGSVIKLIGDRHISALNIDSGSGLRGIAGEETGVVWNIDFSGSSPEVGRESGEKFHRGLIWIAFSDSGTVTVSETGEINFRVGGQGKSLNLADIYGHHAVLADSVVSSLAIVRGGSSLWVGYFDGGVESVDLEGGQSKRFNVPEIREVNCLRTMNDGKVLILSSRGAFTIDNGTVRPVWDDLLGGTPCLDGIQYEGGWAIATSSGLCIMGSSGKKGLPNHPFRINQLNGLPSNRIFSLARSDDTLLVGTLSGVGILKSGKIVRVWECHNTCLPAPWITALEVWDGGAIVGTYGGGIMHASVFPGDGELKPVRRIGPEHLTVNQNAICRIGSTILAGTITRGVLLYNIENGEIFFHGKGLPSRNVTAMTIYADDKIVIGTDRGIVVATLDQICGMESFD